MGFNAMRKKKKEPQIQVPIGKLTVKWDKDGNVILVQPDKKKKKYNDYF